MKETSKSRYTQVYLELLNFSQEIKETWARIDLARVSELLDIIRYYRQFSK